MGKFWQVHYDGKWLGGTAVVVAETAEEALAAVAKDHKTTGFTKASATEIEPRNGVLYNDNGEY